ncbi:MAG: TlpA family protein disulfide reductase [Gammaproteobacteria bacterium]|nr:TlpA family protein disulfide reductase [Gammaproteobacteria bacterium]
MLKPKNVLPILIILFISTISSYGLQRYLNQDTIYNNEQTDDGILIRPEFAMTDLDGQIRNIKDWDGKIILLNFWATWCPPCLSEIPGFIELQKKYGEQGFQVIGIAVDNEEAVRAYAHEVKINYPVIAAEFEAVELSSRYGNRMGALPYSVIINRKGEISDKVTGELSKTRAEKLLKKLNIKS